MEFEMISINHDFTNPYCIDLEECKKSNTLIVGQTGSGKTKLSMGIVDLLLKNGWEVHVFDSVGVWRKSPLTQIMILKSGKVNLCDFTNSTVVDMSRLRIDDQKELLEKYTEWIWNLRVDDPHSIHRPLMIVLEESQNYIKNLRSIEAQNIFRLMMSGRNLGIRVLMISPRINNVSAECRFLANQKYIGLSYETNVLAKIKSLYGKDVMNTCKSLRVGEFIYSNPPLPPVKVRVPEFKTDNKPIIYKREVKALDELHKRIYSTHDMVYKPKPRFKIPTSVKIILGIYALYTLYSLFFY